MVVWWRGQSPIAQAPPELAPIPYPLLWIATCDVSGVAEREAVYSQLGALGAAFTSCIQGRSGLYSSLPPLVRPLPETERSPTTKHGLPMCATPRSTKVATSHMSLSLALGFWSWAVRQQEPETYQQLSLFRDLLEFVKTPPPHAAVLLGVGLPAPAVGV